VHAPVCATCASTAVQGAVLADRYGYLVAPDALRLPRPRTMKQVHAARRFVSLLGLLLPEAVVLAVGGMLLWHTYLVLTAQGTIDFQKNRDEAAEARQQGRVWRNVHDLGPARNWQERFDAQGRWWMLTWLLPRLGRHRGNGCQLPVAPGAQAYLDGVAELVAHVAYF
jgi:hypothetical protein